MSDRQVSTRRKRRYRSEDGVVYPSGTERPSDHSDKESPRCDSERFASTVTIPSTIDGQNFGSNGIAGDDASREVGFSEGNCACFGKASGQTVRCSSTRVLFHDNDRYTPQHCADRARDACVSAQNQNDLGTTATHDANPFDHSTDESPHRGHVLECQPTLNAAARQHRQGEPRIGHERAFEASFASDEMDR